MIQYTLHSPNKSLHLAVNLPIVTVFLPKLMRWTNDTGLAKSILCIQNKKFLSILYLI